MSAMSKNAYIGVDGVARKVKKMYIGVDGVARKVKKAYIGVAGVARLFFSSGSEQSPIIRYGLAPDMSTRRRRPKAASTIDNLLIAGGDVDLGAWTILDTIDAYSGELTRTAPTPMSSPRADFAAFAFKGKAWFAGGSISVYSEYTNTVDVYDADSTKSIAPNLSNNVYQLAGAPVSDFALIAGGLTKDGGSDKYLDTVNVYSDDLTKLPNIALSVGRKLLEATSIGGYALIVGGQNSSGNLATIDAFDEELTRTNPCELGVVYATVGVTTVGDYALVNTNGVVEVIDSNLTRQTPIDTGFSSAAATTLGEYAAFAGGYDTNNAKWSDAVFTIDNDLTLELSQPLSAAKYNMAAGTVGKYALFAGGYVRDGNIIPNTVEVYTHE